MHSTLNVEPAWSRTDVDGVWSLASAWVCVLDFASTCTSPEMRSGELAGALSVHRCMGTCRVQTSWAEVQAFPLTRPALDMLPNATTQSLICGIICEWPALYGFISHALSHRRPKGGSRAPCLSCPAPAKAHAGLHREQTNAEALGGAQMLARGTRCSACLFPSRQPVTLSISGTRPLHLAVISGHLSRRGLTARERFTQGLDGRSRPAAAIQPRRYQGTARPSTEEPGRTEKAGGTRPSDSAARIGRPVQLIWDLGSPNARSLSGASPPAPWHHAAKHGHGPVETGDHLPFPSPGAGSDTPTERRAGLWPVGARGREGLPGAGGRVRQNQSLLWGER